MLHRGLDCPQPLRSLTSHAPLKGVGEGKGACPRGACVTPPSVVGKDGGGCQPTRFLGTVLMLWSKGRYQPQATCKDNEPKHGLERCWEAIWHTEQKPYPKTRRAARSPRRVTGREALASKYLYLLQVLYFMCPLPGTPAGHRSQGQCGRLETFCPSVPKGMLCGSVARLF